MYQKHCPGCFENKQGLAQCPHCGYDESLPRSALLLPHGTMLANTYRIGRVLGKPGGFGVTYLAWDAHLQQRVAVKEYFPRELVARDPETMLISAHQAEQEDHFRFGLDQFLSEARLIAKFDHPNIVRVRNFFRANGTAYMVMDYYEGRSLGDYLLQLDTTLEPEIAANLMLPVLDGLQFVHDRGVVHRDVKPHNIYLTGAGRTILLDFGAARQAAGEEAESLMVVLSEGYAPLEQYQKNSPQGPWTDIYGVGATLYRMIKGKAPPAALDRLGADTLEGDLGLPEDLSVVLRKALGLRPSQRFATALEFKQALAAVFAPGDDGRVSQPSRSITLSPATETRPVAWGAPIDGPTTVRPARIASPLLADGPAPIPATPTAWGPAWLIAGAIVLGALIISLPLWLRG